MRTKETVRRENAAFNAAHDAAVKGMIDVLEAFRRSGCQCNNCKMIEPALRAYAALDKMPGGRK